MIYGGINAGYCNLKKISTKVTAIVVNKIDVPEGICICFYSYLDPIRIPSSSASSIISLPGTDSHTSYLEPFFFSFLSSNLLRLITLSCIDVVTNSIASETSSSFKFCFCSLLTRSTTSELQNKPSKSSTTQH